MTSGAPDLGGRTRLGARLEKIGVEAARRRHHRVVVERSFESQPRDAPAAGRRRLPHQRRSPSAIGAHAVDDAGSVVKDAPVAVARDQRLAVGSRVVLREERAQQAAGAAPAAQLDRDAVPARSQQRIERIGVERRARVVGAGSDAPAVDVEDVGLVGEEADAGAGRRGVELEVADGVEGHAARCARERPRPRSTAPRRSGAAATPGAAPRAPPTPAPPRRPRDRRRRATTRAALRAARCVIRAGNLASRRRRTRGRLWTPLGGFCTVGGVHRNTSGRGSRGAPARPAPQPNRDGQRVAVMGAIPARYGSTRLPGKALLPLAGRPLIEHVYRRVKGVEALDGVVVLTDDQRIVEAVEGFGGRCELTPSDCVSGTDRVAWAARRWNAAAVVNVQGDEPLIDTGELGTVVRHLIEHPEDPMVTLATECPEDLVEDPNAVKVVLSRAGYALYFSRSPVPYARRPGAAAAAAARRRLRLSAGGAARARGARAEPARDHRVARAAAGARERLSDPGATVVRSRRSGSTPRRISNGSRRMIEAGRDVEGKRRELDGDQVHLRHRRRGLVPRQGRGCGLGGSDPRGARLQRHADEARPLRQRRSGDDVALPARRGLRHRRRRRDRPRSRALRALHPHADLAPPQLHHRQDLRGGHQQGAARRLPRLDGPGHPARHRRDQEGDDAPRRRRRHRHRRDRRHRGRHRVAAVPRGHPPAPPRARAQQRRQPPPDAGALHRRRRRAQDQADAALGARAARDRHLARRAALSRRSPALERPQEEDRALHQPRARPRDRGARRRRRSTKCRSCSAARVSTRSCSISSTCRS